MAIAERTLSQPTVAVPRSVAAHAARLDHLDGLKVLLTALVIAHHAGQPYGPTGGRWPIFDPQRAAILGPFFSVNAGFFMGLFFLISAYFVPMSFDRKGGSAFLRDRFVRLGIPLLVGYGVFTALEQQPDVAHLWFVGHLLIYAVLYAAWRRFGPRPGAIALPGDRAIFAYALALGVVTFAVRTVFPIDRWVSLGGLINAEPAHLPQYASLFVFGLSAARGRWLEAMPTSRAMRWLGVAVLLAALRYVPGMPWSGGGYTPVAMLSSIWEAFLCVGFCVGLPVLFRDRLAHPGRLLRWAAPNAFGAYVLHIVPVVVGLQFALVSAPLDPLVKFVIVTAFGIPLSFVSAAVVRRWVWRSL